MEKPIYKWMITRGSPISGNLHINAMSQDPTILRHCGDNPPAVNKFMALLIARPNFLGLSHSYLQEPQDSQVPASKQQLQIGCNVQQNSRIYNLTVSNLRLQCQISDPVHDMQTLKELDRRYTIILFRFQVSSMWKIHYLQIMCIGFSHGFSTSFSCLQQPRGTNHTTHPTASPRTATAARIFRHALKGACSSLLWTMGGIMSFWFAKTQQDHGKSTIKYGEIMGKYGTSFINNKVSSWEIIGLSEEFSANHV